MNQKSFLKDYFVVSRWEFIPFSIPHIASSMLLSVASVLGLLSIYILEGAILYLIITFWGIRNTPVVLG